MRCVPKMETNVIMVYGMGNTTKVIYRPTCIAPGVDTHYVHAYNVASGWTLPDERTKEEREAESLRTSVSRSIRAVRELAACNPWQFFVTITLSPRTGKIVIRRTAYKMLSKLWPSVGVESVKRLCTLPRFCLSTRTRNAQRWRNPLAWFCFVHAPTDCVPYTMSDVNSAQKLPGKSAIKSAMVVNISLQRMGTTFRL